MKLLPPLALGLGLALTGCFLRDAFDERASGANEAATPAAAPAAIPPAGADTTRSSPWAQGLPAALARSVVQPEGNDGSYTVDPFVAALLFEELSITGGAPWLEPLKADGQGSADNDGAPKVGYRVLALEQDSLLAALGLQAGDIVEALNGVVLSGPDRVGFALDGAENRITLMVFRDDYSFTMSYRLSEAVAWRSVLAGFTGDEDPGVGVVASLDPPPGTSNENGTHEGDAPGVEPGVEPPSAGSSRPQATPGGSVARPSTPKPSSTPKSIGSSSPTSGGGTQSGTIRCPSSTRCTIAKATYQDLVASPEKLKSQVKVVPAIRNNVHSGYKLSSIKAGSPAAQLGFRVGDKITHVNGRDLTDDMQALQLYWSLGSTRLFKVRYERGSTKLVKTIAVE